MSKGKRVFKAVLAAAMSVVLASSFATGAAFAEQPSYTAGKVSAQALRTQAGKTGWKTGPAGKTYLKNGSKVVGLQKIKGTYYYFNSKGIMRTSDVNVSGATFYINKSGKVIGAKYANKYYYGNLKPMTSDDSYDFDTFVWARKIVSQITNAGDSDEAKLHKCFDWVMGKFYGIHQPEFNSYERNWPARFARYHFANQDGDCHADASAFAYLAAAIGYPADACLDARGSGTMSSHAWAMIGNKVYDPLFAQSKSYWGYYGVTSGTYEVNPTVRVRVPQYNASNNKDGKVSQALLDAGSMGLKKIGGKYYYFKDGKKVKNAWKTIDGKRYYFKGGGAAATLNTKVNGVFYVFSTTGVLQTSSKANVRVVSFGKNSYQVNKRGKVVPGWSSNGKRYAKAGGRILKKAWKTIDGKRYYFTADGTYATGSVKIDGSYYVFGADGALCKAQKGQTSSLVAVGKDTYRVDANGKAVSGWSDDRTMRFDKTGLLLTGVRFLNGRFYAADDQGVYAVQATERLNAAIEGMSERHVSASELKVALDEAGAHVKDELYSKSCDIEGDDGLWTYQNFVVTTARPSAEGSVEYIRSIMAL